MDTFDSPKRPLPWSLKDFQAVLESETEDDGECSPSSFVWPDDPEERTLVPFYLSQREYTVLSSCIDVGRDIAYSDDAIKVWELWTRNMRCEVSICSMIIACIQNDEDVQAAIVDMLRENEEFNDYITSRTAGSTSGQTGGNLLAGDCNYNVVAGSIIQIIDRLDQNNTDFFEIIEVGTNDEERVSAVISAIPGLSEAPVDEILNMLQEMLTDLAENYAAAITSEWKLEVVEELWCLAVTMPDCALTYGQLFDYFANRAGSGLNLGSLISNIIHYVINGDFSTDELIASGMFTIQLGFILTGREFNGMNIPTIGALARDAGESTAWVDFDCAPDVDWTIAFLPGEPPETYKGTWSQTGNIVTFTAGEFNGYYRIGWHWNAGCFKVVSTDYGTPDFPNNVDCDGVLHDAGIVVGQCYQSLFAARPGPFTVTLEWENC